MSKKAPPKGSALVIERNALAGLLAKVTKVVNARNTIPILDTVRLIADGATLTATATDLDIEVSGAVPCDGKIEVCVDAKLLSGIVNKMPADAEISIAVDGAEVTIKSGRSRFKLHTLPVADFPSMQAGTYGATFTIDLATLVDPVSFAMSNEETRYYLCGAYLHTVDGRLVAVATDGHRLARNSGVVGDLPAGVILPSKLVGMIPDGEVVLSVSDAKVRIEAGTTSITSKVIDGTFPDYQRIIPTGNDKIATVDRDALLSAVSRVSVISSDRGRGIKLEFDDGKIALSVRGDGEATDEVATAWDIEPLTIGFNSAYLAEVLGGLPAGDIEIALADSGAPTIFTSKAAPDYLAIIMPMRV